MYTVYCTVILLSSWPARLEMIFGRVVGYRILAPANPKSGHFFGDSDKSGSSQPKFLAGLGRYEISQL